ncbi:Uncharacterized protein LARI1_G002154 [Lachnellula arida]|uniref:LsmAD domain-containing protein n=1 Tax=Lachnellula arida TaxID=1316785 RepID=A0A8T9BHD6_9HELO|nr:Uncharacterized protein LARI1_G002154 [Lachnellula arida]
MVQGKKPSDMSNTNGTPKSKYQQPNMAFPRKEPSEARGGTNDGRVQNGNASSFRTDSAISGGRNQGERVLQRWVPDAPEDVDGSLESTRMKASGRPWDQFAENERLFGVKTDYDENIYTTPLDKSHPQYKQRIANAEITAREIERSAATNSHVAEERVTDNVKGGDIGDEEDKYSGVRRQQDFPPLSSTNNKYTPPARRAPTGQSTVAGAPVDPAIISSQLARPDKSSAEKKASPGQTPSKPEAATPPTTSELSVTPDPKVAASAQTSSASHNASPHVKSNATPNATATVERDVLGAYKTFASRERINVATIRTQKARNDKEVKLNDLKKFADSFKLNTPVPKDLVSIIAKDPAKQQEIQEKAKRNAEAAKANPAEAAKAIPTTSEAKPATRPVPTTHGATPSSNAPGRQNTNRNTGFQHQGPYNNSQSFRPDRPGAQQAMPSQQARPPGNLGQRLRNIEQQNKHTQLPVNPMPIHEPRLPPTGPSNAADPNFSRRSSGVTSAQGGRLNPNSSEFRPSPHAATFNPNGNPSSGSSPRSAANVVEPPTPATKSLLKHKPVSTSERPSLKEKFNALEHTQSIKPPPGKDWAKTGGTKPAFDTAPTWRSPSDDEKPESTMHLTYPELFEMAPFPTQTLSSPNPSHAIPQVPHQYQLPLHLQQGVHPRQSPRQPPMNLHGNQHGHGPTPPFNGPDDHRMMPSQSAQSYASPRPHNVPMAFPSSPMGQPQLPYNPPMVQYPGAPPMQGFRSLSQNHQFMPQQQHMGPIMMQNPANSFMTSQGMAPGPQVMYPPGGQNHFIPPQNGHPPPMPGVNGGYPSPGRSAAPMMMSQGSQQGHQSQPPMYGNVNPGMSPGPQYGQPIYQQSPGQMPMRGYNGPNQFGTSPQQMHQYGPQHRNNHPNGNNYNNNKNFQPHGQHPNGPSNNQIPNGPQARASEGSEEAK